MSEALNLEAYLEKPVEADAVAIRELDSKLEELADTCFEVEALPRQRLLFQKALYSYRKLDTDFLRMNNRIKRKLTVVKETLITRRRKISELEVDFYCL